MRPEGKVDTLAELKDKVAKRFEKPRHLRMDNSVSADIGLLSALFRVVDAAIKIDNHGFCSWDVQDAVDRLRKGKYI